MGDLREYFCALSSGTMPVLPAFAQCRVTVELTRQANAHVAL